MLYEIKRHDTDPLDVTLHDAQGKRLHLPEGSTVALNAVRRRPYRAIRRTCVLPGGSGQVRVPWTPADVSEPGLYEVEWEIIRSGKRTTLPNSGYDQIKIWRDLG